MSRFPKERFGKLGGGRDERALAVLEVPAGFSSSFEFGSFVVDESADALPGWPSST